MSILTIGFIVLTSITFLLEFYFAFIEKEKIRKIVKPFCLAFLMALIFSLECKSVYLYLALGFGLLGDILLIWEEKKPMFLLGTLSFFIGHIFYIITMASLLNYPIKLWIIISLIVFGIIFPLFPYKFIYKYTKKDSIPGSYYFYILFMETLFASLVLFNTHNPLAILVLLGNIFFIGSDTFLSLTHYVIKIKRKHFYIMLTYLIAQTLLSVGLALLF